MGKNICGIQQVGVGVKNVKDAWKWYRNAFGMDINVFEDTATAKLMKPYTNGQECDRHAALAMNMEGGGGFEIWQHTSIESKAPNFDVKLGDTGIFINKMKCRDIQKAFNAHKEQQFDILGELSKDPAGNSHYYLKDPYNNIFEVVEEANFYKKQNSVTGGVAGVVIGVSDLENAMRVYADILQYSEVIYDKSDCFTDFSDLPGGKEKYRRVLLKHTPRTGPFGRLLGPTQIELVQAIDRKPQKIYKNRIWGELGYIHLCFDIQGMEDLQNECAEKGFPFTVNSADSFDMGSAAGHFSYIADPDGTLIEFVETHKLPIVEKLGWFMNLKDRDPKKFLPNWMVNTLTFSRIKD